MKTLIVYYSNGSHTAQVAHLIASVVPADIEELHVKEPYGDALMNVSKRELENGLYPALRILNHRPEDYDTIILGTPTWWVAPANPILSFVSEHDFKGKKVYPFITTGFDVHGVEDNLKGRLKGADVAPALIVPFSNAFMDLTDDEVLAWVRDNIK